MSRWALRAVVAVVVVVAVVTGLLAAVVPGTPSYRLHAVFASADGLFPGNTVDILGVPSGSVVSVSNAHGAVHVTMEIDGARAVPRGARAALVSPELLGEPSIELSPGYAGGPTMQAGSTIPKARTSVPVSTDQLLRDLRTFLSKINPTATGHLVTNLAHDLGGEGPGINKLLANASGALSLLAQKGNDLGRLEGTLGQIAGTLRGRTATITALIRNYDTVSSVIASHQGQLGKAITDLASATTQLSQFLSPNVSTIESDVSGVTRVGRTLSRNLGSIDQVLASAVLLFTAAPRAYDPAHNWLNLNNELAPGLTASIATGLVRDRLAGICRRLLAHHATGLPANTIQTLTTCGNPSSGYFDPIMGLIPPILNALTDGPGGGPNPAALQALLAKGLAMIPGASSLDVTVPPPGATPAPSPSGPAPAPSGSPAPNSAGPSLDAPAQSQLPPLPTLPSDSQANGGGSGSAGGGMLGGLLGGL